jgi:uncharacterized protein (DUF58 family)
VLTPRGWGLLLAGLVLAVVTWLIDATELLVLTVPALILPVLALFWSRVPFRVGVRRWVEPATVTRGEPCIGALAVTNLRARRSPVLEVVDRRGPDELAILVPRLAPAEVHPTTYHLPTDRRGVFGLGPLTAERGDVFGLARTTVDLGARMTFAVHPRQHHLADLPAGVRASPEGSMQQIPFGNSVFDGLREYVVGDDHRNIHWLSSARSPDPLVRVFRDSSIPTLNVLLDDRAAVYTGDRFEDAVEVAASVLDLAERFDLSLVVTTTGGAGAGRPGERVDRADLLDFLAGLTLRSGDDAGTAGDGGPPFDPTRYPHASTVLLITGALPAVDAGALLTLTASVARVIACIVVPDDQPRSDPDGVRCVQVSGAGQLPARWQEAFG